MRSHKATEKGKDRIMYEVAKLTKYKGHEGEPCYQGDLKHDGKTIAEWSEDGHGGPMRIVWLDVAQESDFNGFCADLPPITDYGTILPMDAELYIGELLAAELELRTFRRQCKRNTLFRLRSHGAHEYGSYNRPYSPQMKAFVESKHDDLVEIINERFA